jgi:hypothetical protein
MLQGTRYKVIGIEELIGSIDELVVVFQEI